MGVKIGSEEHHEMIIEESTATPLGKAALRYAVEAGALASPEALRQEFHNQLAELVDAFDSADHRITAMGSEIQDDCVAVRETVRALGRDS